MEIDYVAIGKRIQKARKKKHMTQRVLAESVDISASHLSNIERGKKPVGLLTLLKICNALNITADSVLIETEFLRSLDAQNFFSGYAEMLKHGLISNTAHWVELLDFNTNNIDYAYLKNMVGRSVQVKEDIVEQDPFERGIRKALNLGHTAGHAFESLALAENRPVLHGYAVAWGIVCELYLSHLKVGFPKAKMRQTIQFIKENYGSFAFDCKQYEQLYAFMQHDKKNTSGTVNFTLLKEIGDICINQTADKDTIFEMLDFYRECMGV